MYWGTRIYPDNQYSQSTGLQRPQSILYKKYLSKQVTADRQFPKLFTISYCQLYKTGGLIGPPVYDETHIAAVIIWQTKLQHGDFEQYGDILSVDFLKDNVTNCAWPLSLLCGIDGTKRLSIFALLLVPIEKICYTKWVIEKLFVMTPRASKSNLKILLLMVMSQL